MHPLSVDIPGILSSLAGPGVGLFVVMVFIDVALGVLGAVRAKVFSVDKLPSFVESQFGTKQALVLAGLWVTAYMTSGQADAHTAVLAALAAGGGAMSIALINDIAGKLKALVS